MPANFADKPKVKGFIVTGFFRTGSTFIFDALRQIEELKVLYEPYHPEIIQYVKEAKLGNEGADKDLLGHSVSENYFNEYLDIDIERMEETFAFNNRYVNHPILNEASVNDDLFNYLSFLLEYGSSKGHVPVLQANRLNYSLGWLKSKFPEYSTILIIRQPYDIYLSLKKIAAKQGINLTIDSPETNFWNVNEIFNSLKIRYPFIKDIEQGYYYRLCFIVMWINMVEIKKADFVLYYESLGSDSVRKAFSSFIGLSGVDASKIDGFIYSKYKSNTKKSILNEVIFIEELVYKQISNYIKLSKLK